MASIALALAGGNALGAYQAGVYQALHEAGIAPDRIAGTSAGAINGAIIAGNAPEQRLERLREFWRPRPPGSEWADWWVISPDVWRRTSAAVETLVGGRAGIFAPLGSSIAIGDGRTPALYDMWPLAATLAQLVDFNRLNAGAIRYEAVAVDLESGAEVVFDTRERTVVIDHIRASAALPPTFPAVEIDQRLLVDGGLAMNLPLDPLLLAPATEPTLCIAIDLLPAGGARPRTFGDVLTRTQDLIFAAQSRRTLGRIEQLYALSPAFREQPVTLVHLAYVDDGREVAGKAMDFSPESVRFRWDRGHRDGTRLTERLSGGRIPLDRPGLTLLRGADM